MNHKIKLTLLACLLAGAAFAQQKTAVTTKETELQQKALDSYLKSTDDKIEARKKIFYDEKNKHYDTIGLSVFRADIAKLKEIRKQQQLDFIAKHPNEYVSLTALNDVMSPFPTDVYQIQKSFSQLAASLKNSELGKRTAISIDKLIAIQIGKRAPDFAAPDTLGKIVHLSDYKGRYVLLDFWASWCVPCREENPNVVAAYQRFHTQKFDILSVSLDKADARAQWLAAIQKDGLSWQHVSDLKFWNSEAAQLYMVKAIPQNFLIDPQGKIIAKDLRGEELTKKLQEILPKK